MFLPTCFNVIDKIIFGYWEISQIIFVYKLFIKMLFFVYFQQNYLQLYGFLGNSLNFYHYKGFEVYVLNKYVNTYLLLLKLF